jgi:filamentous hemagglutinin
LLDRVLRQPKIRAIFISVNSIFLQGIKQGVNYGGASIFITSGVGRGLLKLTEKQDTEWGRAISEVLFYLEMAAIVGYVGVGVHAFIQRSAQKALTHTDEIEKIYREVDELTKKNTDEFDNVIKSDELVAAEERLAAVKKLEEIAGGASNKLFGLWKINSQVGKLHPKAGKFNCGNTAMAVEYTLAGKPASALPWTYEVVLKNGKPIQEISYIAGTRLKVLEKEFGKVFIKNMTPNKIRQILKPGQQGIVFGVKKGNKLGHFFNAVNEKGVIKFLDGQKVVERASDTQKARLVYDYYEFLPTNF